MPIHTAIQQIQHIINAFYAILALIIVKLV